MRPNHREAPVTEMQTFDVVIPAHNASDTIIEQLDAVRRNDAAGLAEVVVADSCSTDATPDIVRDYSLGWSKVRLVAVDKPGANTARSAGVRAGSAQLVLMCDADDVVAEGWAEALVTALDELDVVRGRYALELLNDADTIAARGSLASTGPPPDGEPVNGLGGNCGFRRAAWVRLGGLAEHHSGSDDVEFFWRATQAGMMVGYAEDAVVHYRLRAEYDALYRQQRAWALNRPLLFKEFRDTGFIRRRSLEVGPAVLCLAGRPCGRLAIARPWAAWNLAARRRHVGRASSRLTPLSDVVPMTAQEVPTVSVVIPALNAAGTIGEQLDALAEQFYDEPWEIIVVDNGSTDGTGEVAQAAERHPRCAIRVVVELRRGLNVARNAGVCAASSELIAICDADDVVSEHWLAVLVDGLSKLDMIGGGMSYSGLNDVETLRLRGWLGLDEPRDSVGREFGFLDQLICGNVAFRRAVWEQVDGFDEEFAQGGDDVDFSWRVQLAGFEVGSDPRAVLHYRGRGSRRQLFQQSVRDGAGGAHLYAMHRFHGMPRRAHLVGVKSILWILLQLPTIPFVGQTRQGHLIRACGKQWGRIRGSLSHRVLYL